MAGLGEAASIIAVLQVVDRVLGICGKYALAVKDAKEDISRLMKEIKSLNSVLKIAHEMANNGGMNEHISESVLEALAGSIQECQSTLHELEKQLDLGKDHKLMSRFGLRALRWPLKSRDVTKIMETLNQHKGTIILALNLDQR
jgi:hypothetical protein